MTLKAIQQNFMTLDCTQPGNEIQTMNYYTSGYNPFSLITSELHFNFTSNSLHVINYVFIAWNSEYESIMHHEHSKFMQQYLQWTPRQANKMLCFTVTYCKSLSCWHLPLEAHISTEEGWNLSCCAELRHCPLCKHQGFFLFCFVFLFCFFC